jgi:crossover junction endodeoxyribonuclease RuvC
MKPLNVLGIDLSMNATGLTMLSMGDPPDCPDFSKDPGGRLYTNGFYVGSLGRFGFQGTLAASRGDDTLSRWESVLLPVLDYAMHANRVLIEGYAFSRNMAFARALTEFGGIVRYHLRKIGHAPIEISPSSLKKFVTGKGNADKDQMVSGVQKTYGIEIPNHNMADSFGLAQIGRALGFTNAELMQLPAHQREVIRAIKHPPAKVKPSKESPICESFTA